MLLESGQASIRVSTPPVPKRQLEKLRLGAAARAELVSRRGARVRAAEPSPARPAYASGSHMPHTTTARARVAIIASARPCYTVAAIGNPIVFRAMTAMPGCDKRSRGGNPGNVYAGRGPGTNQSHQPETSRMESSPARRLRLLPPASD
jgi:hypothetical protein